VSKGEVTRSAILEEAGRLARRVGLGGLTIGSLATQTGMSKSGLFAHFGSKESLQLQVVDHNAERFTTEVIRPALKSPRGEPRLRELFERWLEWSSAPGGCPLVAAAFELDDQPGAVRDQLVQTQRDWLETVMMVVTGAITERHFRPDVDPCQFAQDVEGVMLAYHLTSRLLADAAAGARARRAFDALIAAAAA
jgi:AcrR family transcriptional regulator